LILQYVFSENTFWGSKFALELLNGNLSVGNGF